MEIISEIRETCPQIKKIAMTTNGSVILRKLERLQEAGLTDINFSLDSLVEAKSQFITRRPGGFLKTMKAIDKSLELGFESIKVNVVVMKGFNDDEITDFVQFTKDKDLEVRFIEFMPFDQNSWNDGKFVSFQDMLKVIEPVYALERKEQEKSAVSKVYTIQNFKGRVGFITSMS